MIVTCINAIGQASGNINYRKRTQIRNENVGLTFNKNNELIIKVKGLYNIKADSYLAIFSVIQTGETKKEVNDLLNSRIDSVRSNLKKISSEIEVFIDMISFVPIYEFEVEKKIFSKDTYNEIPKGFELKKNIHIKYFDAKQLDDFVSACADAEIYELVRVDYVVSDIESKKKEVITKAKSLTLEKFNYYQELLQKDLKNLEKEIIDGFKLFYPVERYRSYQAYSSNSLNIKRAGEINTLSKSTTQYYMPVFNKEFDFVIDPAIIEPVVQLIYEVNLKIKLKPIPIEKPSKEYLILTPNGSLRQIEISN